MSRPTEVEASLRAEGIRRLEAGWSVVPCYPDKTPSGRWTELQRKQLSLVNFQSRLNRTSESGDLPTSLAVVTGELSGIVILDFDGEEGQKLIKELGLKPHIRTGSGGYHVYFKHPGQRIITLNSKSKKSLGNSFPGLDIRGDGGYAIFTGSSAKGGYQIERDLSELEDLDTLPKPVQIALGLLPPEEKPIESVSVAQAPESSPLAVKKLNEAIGQARRGEGRNNTGYWLAQQLRDNRVPWSEATKVMQEYQQTVTNFPDGHGEASEYSWEEASTTLRGVYDSPPREPEGKKTLKPTLRSKSVFESRYSLGELLEQPDKGWYLKDFLAPQELVMIAGQPGSGKTFLVLDLCMSLALGKHWARTFEFEPKEPLRVAYFAGEGIGRLGKRVQALLRGYGVSLEDVGDRFEVFGGVPNLANLDDPNSVLEIVQEYKSRFLPLPHVIVIDTLARSIPGSDENSSRDAGQVIAALEYLKQELGCSVIVVHHTGKGGESERGSSAFRGAMDALYKVVKNSSDSSLIAEKIKDAEAFQDVSFSLLPLEESCCISWGPGVIKSNPLIDFLRNQSGQRFSLEEIKEGAGLTQSDQTYRNHLKKFVEDGKVKTSGGGKGQTQRWWVETIKEGLITVDFSRLPSS